MATITLARYKGGVIDVRDTSNATRTSNLAEPAPLLSAPDADPRPPENSQIKLDIPPPRALGYDDVFESRERDKVACGEEGGQERVAGMGVELNAEGGGRRGGILWVLYEVRVGE